MGVFVKMKKKTYQKTDIMSQESTTKRMRTLGNVVSGKKERWEGIQFNIIT